MFDSVRNSKKIVQGLLILIAASFTLYGVDSYVRGADGASEIASAGDVKISQQEFQRALREQMDAERQRLGANFRQEAFDSREMRLAIANALIDRRLLFLEALENKLGVSNALLAEIIGNMPSLQEDGHFSQARYEEAVRAQGMSVGEFEAQMRHDLTLQQLVGAVGDTGIVPAKTAERLLRIQGEERQVAEVRILPEEFIDSVQLDDDAAEKFYTANAALFEVPERLRAEYVTLALADIMAHTKVSDAEVKSWYEDHLASYQQAEERRASHILLSVDGADDDKVRAQAEALLAEVQKNPASFAAVAKRASQDPGSASAGGDLGFFARGMMVKAFDDAVFALKENQISDLVRSDFGYHIIMLTGVKPGRQKALAEVAGEISDELKRQAAQRQYAEAAESFANMVYEQSDSLAPVVEKFALKIETSPPLVRNPAPEQRTALGNIGSEKVLNALFGDDAIKEKRNTEAIEVAPNVLLAARVVEHQPATQRPLASVRADIEQMLRQQALAAAARDKGEATLARLQKGEEDADQVRWALVKSVSRLDGRQVPPAAMSAIFGANVEQLPAYAGASLPNGGGYALYKIMAVKPLAEIDPDKRRVLQTDYTAIAAQEDFAAYLAGLRQRHQVKINLAALLADRER